MKNSCRSNHHRAFSSVRWINSMASFQVSRCMFSSLWGKESNNCFWVTELGWREALEPTWLWDKQSLSAYLFQYGIQTTRGELPKDYTNGHQHQSAKWHHPQAVFTLIWAPQQGTLPTTYFIYKPKHSIAVLSHQWAILVSDLDFLPKQSLKWWAKCLQSTWL